MQDSLTSRTTPGQKKANNEWRCECGKLLFKGAFLAGLLEVKCTRCKRLVYLQQFNSYTADNQSFMATIGLDGTILTISHGASDAVGYLEEEMSGTNFIDYLDPKFYAAAGFWMEGLEAEKNGGKSYISLVVPLLTKDSQEKVFSLLIKPTNLGGRDIYLVIAEAGLTSADSHDRKVLSKLAQKSRQQREGWDFIIDQNGLVTEMSGKSELGYDKDQLLDKSFLDILDVPSKQLQDKLLKQESFVLDLDLKTKSSGLKKCKVCFSPDFLADPREPAFIVAIRPQTSL